MRLQNFLKKLNQVTFVTKSGKQTVHGSSSESKKLTKEQKKETEEHQKNGDIFSDVFTTSKKFQKVNHISIDEFLEKGLSPEEEKGHLVCTLGGDGTFILTAQKIENNHAYALGINPEPKNSLGELCGFTFNDEKDIEKSAKKLLARLEHSQLQVVKRRRAKVHSLTKPDRKFPLGSI